MSGAGFDGEDVLTLQVARDLFVKRPFFRRGPEVFGERVAIGEIDTPFLLRLAAQCTLADPAQAVLEFQQVLRGRAHRGIAQAKAS
jgi:hypothetical protein